MSDSPQITPSVGRKVWFFKSAAQAEPWDATVIAVHHEGQEPGPLTPVSLFVIAPNGNTGAIHNVVVSDEPVDRPHYRWMPYQKGQAAKAEVAQTATETVTYTDGTTATGHAPLPDVSPDGVPMAETSEKGGEQ